MGARPDRHRPALALLILTGLNAVDELARSSFSVVAPTIADHFGVGLAGVTMPFVLAFKAVLALSVPIAGLADRRNRVRLAMAGGTIFAVCSTLVGLAPNLWVLAVFLAASNLGKVVIEPATRRSWPTTTRSSCARGVFSFHRAGNAVGALVGGIGAATWPRRSAGGLRSSCSPSPPSRWC